MLDIDFDNESISKILHEQILPTKTDNTIIEKLQKMKISSHWFLDAHYSDEFEELIKEAKSQHNLDKLINQSIDKVFYPEEKIAWTDKLLMSAYMKYAIGKDDEASINLWTCSR